MCTHSYKHTYVHIATNTHLLTQMCIHSYKHTCVHIAINTHVYT
ncbi:hypothetical protein NP493_708g01017 [Ridgeia piscesae]|uniref:Uncharacterized protein n=1 Tax=Ridgeia piscesae TaxID=27915 RepID=A0AAD9NMT2_RIDPI|nr:hypothetical protein NP493_708g01017 [Ridgeia piscesae]